MARRGSFGRLPRSAPSLTSTIIAIAREMAAARERNLMDAWNNGGSFEGSKVTDTMVLAYWKDKQAGLDKSDPAYDEAKNTHDQLDFGINESKQRLLYDQGKISATTMAHFYLTWAKKIPQGSEFYRTLQTRAAQFVNTEKGKRRSGTAAADKAVYDSAQAATAKPLDVSKIVTDVLTGIAITNGLVDAVNPKLEQMNDPAKLQEVLDRANADPNTVLWLGEDGSAITSGEVFKALDAADPNFKYTPSSTAPDTGDGRPGRTTTTAASGGMTTDYIISALQGAHAANLALADRAANTKNKKTDEKKYRKAAGQVAELVRDAKLWGIAPAYNMIITARDAVLNNPHADGSDKFDALETAAKGLNGLARTPGLDGRSIVALGNEAAANVGQSDANNAPTFGQDYLGTHQPTGELNTSTSEGNQGAPGSNAWVSALWQQLNGEQAHLQAFPDDGAGNGFVRTFGTRDPKTGVFAFDPKGTEVGVVAASEVLRGADAATDMLINGKLVTVVGHEVRSVAYDANGVVIKPGTPLLDENGDPQLYETGVHAGEPIIAPMDDYLATVFVAPNGGTPDRYYQLPDGSVVTTPPWAQGANGEHDNPDGTVTVTVTGLVAGAPYYNPRAVAIDGVIAAGLYDPDTHFGSMLAANVATSDNPREAADALLNNPAVLLAWRQQQADASNVTIDVAGNAVSGDAQSVRTYDIMKGREMTAVLSAAGRDVTPERSRHPTGASMIAARDARHQRALDTAAMSSEPWQISSLRDAAKADPYSNQFQINMSGVALKVPAPPPVRDNYQPPVAPPVTAATSPVRDTYTPPPAVASKPTLSPSAPGFLADRPQTPTSVTPVPPPPRPKHFGLGGV